MRLKSQCLTCVEKMITELDQLADRHLRSDPQGALADPGEMKSGVVLVQVSKAMAGVLATQHLVWMLVSLLSRQFKVVKEIVLDVPDVALYPAVAPFGVMPSLLEALEECVRLISGPHVKVRRLGSDVEPDVSLVIGDCEGGASKSWRLFADGWRYFVGTEGKGPSLTPRSELSIGPYLCACFAAGEVFKLLRGMKPGKGRFIQSHFASAWTMSRADTWEELVDGPSVSDFGALPHFYFAGGGAVAQAAALCLGSSGFAGACSVVDKDKLDLTNDNRYALAGRADDGTPKVDLMRRYLLSRGFDCQAIQEWWQDFAKSGGRHAPNESVRRLEREYRFPIVLSCVDKNGPRHALQNVVPHLLVGGSTDGLSAKASIFDLGFRTACLKCHNPLQSRNAIIQERKAVLQKLEGERRVAHARELGLSDKDVELLFDPGGCGKLSESDLARFAADLPEMSVGFVSLAAGVLLIAQFLRYLKLGGAKVNEGGSLAIATFARDQLRTMHVGRDSACDCRDVLHERWLKTWVRSYPT